MNFLECVQSRRSVRLFRQEQVSEEAVRKIVQLASYAPSWKNSQTTRYIAISDQALLKEIAEKCTMDFEHNKKIILGAPMLVLLNTVSPRSGFERDGSPTTKKGTHWESFDAGIAAQTFCLAAHELKLGTVILGIYDEEKIKQIANVPDGQKISALIAMGYASNEPEMPKRKEVDELVSFI